MEEEKKRNVEALKIKLFKRLCLFIIYSMLSIPTVIFMEFCLGVIAQCSLIF